MPAPESHEIDELLARHAAGDEAALDELVTLLYDDLRRIAHRHLTGEAPGHTINTTALVHEAYLELAADGAGGWQNRAHFMAAASRVMRHVLVDYARHRRAEKRGGTRVRVPIDDATAVADAAPDLDLIALDTALTDLASHDAGLGRIVEYRFFGGMSMGEVAAALGLPLRTAERGWTRARAYLYRALAQPNSSRRRTRDES